MEELINVDYLVPLLTSWIVSGWILMVKSDSDSTLDYVPLHHTQLYELFTSLPLLGIFISLVINIFMVSFISTVCYIGMIVITQLININILYYLYRRLFGRDGIGTVLPMALIIPLLIYLFIVQLA